MTYAGNETSREGGAPVELYTITFGSQIFRYAASEDNVISGPSTFTAVEIQRSGISDGPENRGQTIEVQLKGNNEFASQFIGVQPSKKAKLTIHRFHRFDTPGLEQVQIFEGQVRTVSFSESGFKAKLSVMPLTGALARTIPLYTFQSPCNNVLYDSKCQVIKASFTFNGTVTAVSADGLTLTVPGLDAAKTVGFATGGQVEIASTSDPRLVLAHSATDQLKILLPFSSSVVGVAVNVLAGCDHSLPVCKTKFDNVLNHAGHPFVPTRNPFESGLDSFNQ